MPPLVLNVDSNVETRNHVSNILSHEGVQLEEAESVEQCLTVARTASPDLIVIAPGVAGGSGHELCAELSYSTDALRILRILHTAPEASSRADAYVSEPVNAVALQALVRTMIRFRTTEKDRAAAVRALAAAQQEARLCLGRVGHDLAEVIRGVAVLIDLTRAEGSDPLTGGKDRLVDSSVKAADRLRQMIQDLVSYAQIPLDPLSSHHPVNMAGVLAAAQAQLRGALDDAGAEVHAGDLPVLLGNPARLQQLLTCLLANSVKFRSAGVAPVIRIAAVRESKDWWRIAIQDNGVGVAAAYHGSIFQPFQRLHGRDVPGAGMGLALSRRIVEAHGGKLWIESERGKGATFLMTLPAAQ